MKTNTTEYIQEQSLNHKEQQALLNVLTTPVKPAAELKELLTEGAFNEC